MIAYYILLISISLALGIGGLLLFLWCFKTNQFEDLDGAAERIFIDDFDNSEDFPDVGDDLKQLSVKDAS